MTKAEPCGSAPIVASAARPAAVDGEPARARCPRPRASRPRRPRARRAPRRRRAARSRRARSRRADAGRRAPGRPTPIAQPQEVLRLQVLRDRAQAVVAGRARRRPAAASRPRSKSPSSCTTSTASGSSLKKRAAAPTERPGLVHERLGLQQRELVAVEPDLGELPGELRAPRAAVPARELVDDEPADVVAVARVLAARVAETDDEQVERRPLAAGPEPHRGLALGGARVAGGVASGSAGASAPPSAPRPRRPRPRRPRPLRLGLLGLDLARRRGDRRDDGLRIVEERDALADRRCRRCGACRPIAMCETSRSMCSGTSSGSASTWISRSGCESTPPSLHARRVLAADQVHGDGRGDRLVEPNLVQVDVRDAAADLVQLVVLEDRGVRRCPCRRSRRRGSSGGRPRRSARGEARAPRRRSRPARRAP